MNVFFTSTIQTWGALVYGAGACWGHAATSESHCQRPTTTYKTRLSQRVSS